MATIIDTNITVLYEEMDGSPQEHFRDDGAFEATRTLQCDWASRDTLIKQLLGDTIATTGNSLVKRPHKYPGNPLAVATEVSGIQGVGRISSSDNMASYTKARFQVKYVQLKNSNNLHPDSYLYWETFKPTCGFMSIGQGGNYTVNGQQVTLHNGIQLMQFSGEWQITRRKLNIVPNNLLQYVGWLNNSSIKSALYGKTFDIGTLMFMEPDFSQEVLNDGTGVWTVTLKLAYKEIGWNNHWVMDLNTKTPFLCGITEGATKLRDAQGNALEDLDYQQFNLASLYDSMKLGA